jgi:hypothetical protein
MTIGPPSFLARQCGVKLREHKPRLKNFGRDLLSIWVVESYPRWAVKYPFGYFQCRMRRRRRREPLINSSPYADIAWRRAVYGPK